nr:hypothetical protein [Tanacetum cinerariifolium]
KHSKTFDELMSTLIDFSTYIMNGLKITNLTQETLLGLAFRLLKGTRSNYAELEYNFKECYNALSEKLDWNNPKGVTQVEVMRKHGYVYLREIENRITNLSGDDVSDFAIALQMFTRNMVIQRRVEDLQLGDKSYQKKINVTKPKNTKARIRKYDSFTPYQDPQGFIYVDTLGRNRLMHLNELYKFSDGTLTRL